MALNEQELMDAQDLISRASRSDLTIIAMAFNDRQKALMRAANRTAARHAVVGATGKFGPSKPQYLTGRRVEVVEIRQTRILVKLLDGPVGKFSSGRVLTKPASIVWDEA